MQIKEKPMSFFNRIWEQLETIANISDHIDKPAASRSIRNNIHFKGPNIWILAFSIIIASVGLNVNSIPVVIGAMLISPLMGPIFGVGLGLGVNDINLLKDSLKNLLIMVAISLIASFLYFLITPLSLANPTELLARTNPTIYDVLIALFGGFAGIFELCRKEKGTVFSGVAIATALMPPLCTAGFGLAQGNLIYFIGALYLFFINCIFITLATYITVKYLKFSGIEFADQSTGKRTKRIISIVVFIVIIPSIWSAVVMIRENNFNEHALEFVNSNKLLSKGYIYDHKISHRQGSKVEIFISGDPLTAQEKSKLVASAKDFGINEDQLVINESLAAAEGSTEKEIVQSIYEQVNREISKRDEEISSLKRQISEMKSNDIPYLQITKEVVSQYPEITGMQISRGADIRVEGNEYHLTDALIIMVRTTSRLDMAERSRLEEWLKIRLNTENLVLQETNQE